MTDAIEPQDRFQELSNQIIHDKVNDLYWMPKDSYLDLGKWINWQDALSYARLVNSVYAGGFSDWRLPTRDEASSLYEETCQLLDWAGEVVCIHPGFVPKCSHVIWIYEAGADGKTAMTLNLRDGTFSPADKDTREGISARLVRRPKSG